MGTCGKGMKMNTHGKCHFHGIIIAVLRIIISKTPVTDVARGDPRKVFGK